MEYRVGGIKEFGWKKTRGRATNRGGLDHDTYEAGDKKREKTKRQSERGAAGETNTPEK
jgi:hypothetical protein